MKMEMVMPIGYEINARQSHFTEDGKPIWAIDYKEYHTEEGYEKAKPDSVELFDKMGFGVLFNDEEKSASWKIQGPKYQIVNMLAAEFLAISSIGEMPIKDLLGTLMNALGQSGFKAKTM